VRQRSKARTIATRSPAQQVPTCDARPSKRPRARANGWSATTSSCDACAPRVRFCCRHTPQSPLVLPDPRRDGPYAANRGASFRFISARVVSKMMTFSRWCGSTRDWFRWQLARVSPYRGPSAKFFRSVFRPSLRRGVRVHRGVWRLEGRRSALWWLIAALIFCVVALFAAPLLGPLNRAWRWLSLQVFRIVNPMIMGIVFFAVLTPIAITMRCAGRYPLRLRFEPSKPSYWRDRSSRGERQTSMTHQF
jgi:hypothetical protein